VPETEAATTTWRGIDELAELIGGYCWVEKGIFEAAGAWATGVGDGGLEPAVRVWCAGVSRRHGLLAARWAEHLPVRAGVDRAALVVPPDGSLADALALATVAPAAGVGVAALIETVLPRLQAAYQAHSQTPNPVSEAPILEVLAGAPRDLADEISGGRALLGESATG
jgi:hypothetical protein